MFTKAARLGAGTMEFSPFTAFHITSVNSPSGIRSSLEKSNRSLFLCHAFVASFFSLISVCSGFALNDVRSGWAEKHLQSGVAAASYWLIGGMPNISSIVRKTDVVEYIV